MTTASGIGSWPGTDIREVIRLVRDTLGSLGAEGPVPGPARDEAPAPDVRGLPYLPELPQRGPGADLVGRGAGLLVDLPVDLQPSGWRLVDRPGRDAGRTASMLTQDLDELAEAYDGWTGRLKLQVTGPWSLAASIWLHRGERLLVDEGATRDLVESLTEGVRVHLATVQRLVPGAELVLQVDEPSLPAVLEGLLPTASGYGRVRVVDPTDALTALRGVLEGAGGRETLVHCCAPGAPLALLRQTGGGIAVDTTLLGPRGWEGVAVAVDEGIALYAGCVPTDPATSTATISTATTSTATTTPDEVADAMVAQWRRLDLPLASLDAVVMTPSCGLGTLSDEAARRTHRLTIESATELTERAVD
ncbi:MAG: methionine synthase [Actinomycetota bacterium]|nr:methionine synthase [Actinomycetota bacterium]